MILSASRRTDIPNYYSDWFFNRLQEGFLYVRNPMNAHQISKIDLSPDVIDCIVFWTKNPRNMMNRLEELQGYDYYFQFSITGYGKDVEPNIPDKKEVIIPTFVELSKQIEKKVIWRYDPILLSERYTIEYHLKAFEVIASKLSGYTERVIISFVDLYTKTQRNTADLKIQEITKEKMIELANRMAEVAKKYSLIIETCAEEIELEAVGVQHGSCIDKKLIEEIIDCKLTVGKDKNQRDECGCYASVEIGTYNTCLNGCRYCYANFSESRVEENIKFYDPNSPLLCGVEGECDKITERKVETLKDIQRSLFDAL